MKCDITDRQVDGGYGWIIVLSAFSLTVITDGIFFSFGNLLIELIKQFDEERAETAVIGSVLLGMACLIGPFTGSACKKYGCRVVAVFGAVTSCAGFLISTFATSLFYLYISYGLIGGVGLGCMYLSANVIVLQHFNRYRGLACGATLCGSGVGTFLFNLFTHVLLNYYGWRGTVLIEAGVCFQGAVFGLLLLHPVQLKEKESDALKPNEPDFTTDQENITTQACTSDEIKTTWKQKLCHFLIDTSLLTDRKLWIFLLSTFVVHLAFPVVIGFAADSAIESGLSQQQASWLASSIGIANTASRIILGWVSDRKFVCRMVMLCVLLILAGLSTIFLFLLKSFATRILCTSLYGFFIGGYIVVCSPVLSDLFQETAKSFGMYLFAIGWASIISTPIGGLLFDKTGSYDNTFIVAGCELIIGGILILMLKWIAVKRKQDNPNAELNQFSLIRWKDVE